LPTIRIWDTATGKEKQEIDNKSIAESLSLAFAPDGKTLACAGAWNDSSFLPKGAVFKIQGIEVTRKEGNAILLWNTATGKEVRRFTGLGDKLKSVAFAPDGRTLAAAASDGRIALWDVATGTDRLYIGAHPNGPSAEFSPAPGVVFAPDGKTLASAGTDGTIRLWDTRTAKELGQLAALDTEFRCLALSTDGKLLITGSADGSVLVWDWAEAGKPRKQDRPNVIFIR
jgi:WD40 repeat protein